MLSLILEYRSEFQFAAGLLICTAALVWGGGPERAIGLVWLLMVEALDMSYHALFDATFTLTATDAFHASLDIGLSAAFVTIAIQANRTYCLWIAALQLVATTAHFAREIATMMTPIAYAILAIGPSYFQILLLAIGLIFHIRRKKTWGSYRDWRIGAKFLASSIFNRLDWSRK